MAEKSHPVTFEEDRQPGETRADWNKRRIQAMRDKEEQRQQEIAERAAAARRQQGAINGGKKAKQNPRTNPGISRTGDPGYVPLEHTGRTDSAIGSSSKRRKGSNKRS